MAHDHHDSHAAHNGTDIKAALIGLVIGAFVVFGILRTIVALTNAHYAHETPAASTH